MARARKKPGKAKKVSNRLKATKNRRFDEHVLTTIDGASANVEIDTLMPSTSVVTGKRHLFRIVRVDQELDAVYGVIVETCPMPWWKWNLLFRQGIVDVETLEEFNRTTVGTS